MGAPTILAQVNRAVWTPKQGTTAGALRVPIGSGNTEDLMVGSVIKLSSGNAVKVTAGSNVLGIITRIFDQYGNLMHDLVRTGGSVAATCEYWPIGNVELLTVLEDGVGNVIADPTATPYVNLVQGNLLASGTQEIPRTYQINALIDSSTASASASGFSFQIVNIPSYFDNIRQPDDTTSLKAYGLRVVEANIEYYLG